jgi:putative mRNA 3-end processing factor
MAVRGVRRRRGSGRGFVLSDHADWDGLLRTVRESGARKVLVTHGQGEVLARYLREVEGLAADPLATGRAAEAEGESSEDQELPNGAVPIPEERTG